MSKEKIEAQVGQIIQNLLKGVPEEAHEFIMEKLTEMSEKVSKRTADMTDPDEALDMAKAKAVIEYYLPMGEALHGIAHVDMLDSEDSWEDLTTNAKEYWATLAFRINFNPEEERCPCLGHLAECYDELFQEGKVDPVTANPIGHPDGPEMVEIEVSNPSELPDAILKVLRDRGIDPNDVTIQTMKVPSGKSH